MRSGVCIFCGMARLAVSALAAHTGGTNTCACRAALAARAQAFPVGRRASGVLERGHASEFGFLWGASLSPRACIWL